MPAVSPSAAGAGTATVAPEVVAAQADAAPATPDAAPKVVDTSPDAAPKIDEALAKLPPLFAVTREKSIAFFADANGVPKENGAVTLDAEIVASHWFGPDEIVVLFDGGRVGRVKGSTVSLLKEPADDAWKPPAGYVANPDARHDDDTKAMVDLKVEAGVISKARCVEHVWEEGERCQAWSWLALVTEPDKARYVGFSGNVALGGPAPGGFSLKVISSKSSDGERPGTHRVTCKHDKDMTTFPAPDDGNPYGIIDILAEKGRSPMWLEGQGTLWIINAEVPALDTATESFVFDGCSTEPIGESYVRSWVLGPDGWLALSPSVGENRWLLFRGGKKVSEIMGDQLVFAPKI